MSVFGSSTHNEQSAVHQFAPERSEKLRSALLSGDQREPTEAKNRFLLVKAEGSSLRPIVWNFVDVPACPEFGGKAAGLARLAKLGCKIPDTVAVSAGVFRLGDMPEIARLRDEVSPYDKDCHLSATSLEERIKQHILEKPQAVFPQSLRELLAQELPEAHMSGFAIRSSATDEDGASSSFAGMYKTRLGVIYSDLVEAIADVLASAYSHRVIQYRKQRSDQATFNMAIIVQPTIQPEFSGVAFSQSPHPESNGEVSIECVPGFGANLVDGKVSPFHYSLCRDTLKMVSAVRPNGLPHGALDEVKDGLPVHTVRQIAREVLKIEQALQSPIDLEWLHTKNGRLIFLQARPITQFTPVSSAPLLRYQVLDASEPMGSGAPITGKVTSGRLVRYDKKPRTPVPEDSIVYADTIDVDWYPVLQDCRGVVTARGGFTSHIAIILRESGIPSVIGVGDDWARSNHNLFKATVTLDCSGQKGIIYQGKRDYVHEEIRTSEIPKPEFPTYLVTSSTRSSAELQKLPLSGIGLVRMEFLVAQEIGIHPLAIHEFDRGTLDDPTLAMKIASASSGYNTAYEWYVETLSNALSKFAKIAAGRRVNVRLPDFIADDYLTLLGGDRYEIGEEPNPMLGFRGTTKLISEQYEAALAADCQSIADAFQRRGFHNLAVILPFCRTPEDAQVATRKMRSFGLAGIQFGMMVEIPSNILLADAFVKYFDFFLVGPMDLTQLTYAADRKTTALGSYSDQTAATFEFVKLLLQKISWQNIDVFIGGWPLCQYFQEYKSIKTNNRLHLVELPDRIIEFLENANLVSNPDDRMSEFDTVRRS